MFTLNRLSVIGLGAGLVLVGCASPTDETADPTDQVSEGVVDENANAVDEQAALAAPTEDFSAMQQPDEQQVNDEGQVEQKSDKIIVGPMGGIGWGGGWGMRGVGWGGGWGMPGVGWGMRGVGWGMPGWGGAWGVPGVGWGGGWGYGAGYNCGLYGCVGGRFW